MAKLKRIDCLTIGENEVNAVTKNIPTGYRLLRPDEPRKNGDMYSDELLHDWLTLYNVPDGLAHVKYPGHTYITRNDDQPPYTNTYAEQRTINFLAEMQGRIETMIRELRNGV